MGFIYFLFGSVLRLLVVTFVSVVFRVQSFNNFVTFPPRSSNFIHHHLSLRDFNHRKRETERGRSTKRKKSQWKYHSFIRSGNTTFVNYVKELLNKRLQTLPKDCLLFSIF